MAGGRAFKSNVRERREAERRMKALEKRQKKEEKRKQEQSRSRRGPGADRPPARPALTSVVRRSRRHAGHRSRGKLSSASRRRTQVAKGEVCKTSMHRFESGRRLFRSACRQPQSRSISAPSWSDGQQIGVGHRPACRARRDSAHRRRCASRCRRRPRRVAGSRIAVQTRPGARRHEEDEVDPLDLVARRRLELASDRRRSRPDVQPTPVAGSHSGLPGREIACRSSRGPVEVLVDEAVPGDSLKSPATTAGVATSCCVADERGDLHAPDTRDAWRRPRRRIRAGRCIGGPARALRTVAAARRGGS